jgi:hypothetical protein
VLGNGTWLNVGGNQAIMAGGLTSPDQVGGGPYEDPDGGMSYVLHGSFSPASVTD